MLEYTIAIIAMMLLSILLFKLKIPVICFVFGVIDLGLCASQLGNTEIAFSPYLQMACMMLGLLLAFYSVRLFRGVD